MIFKHVVILLVISQLAFGASLSNANTNNNNNVKEETSILDVREVEKMLIRELLENVALRAKIK